MMADWSLTAGLAQSDSRTSSPMCRRPSGTDCREQVSIKSGRPVAKKVGSAREATNSPRASVFVYNIFYGVLADEAGRFPVTGNYTTTSSSPTVLGWASSYLRFPCVRGVSVISTCADPLPQAQVPKSPCLFRKLDSVDRCFLSLHAPISINSTRRFE